MRTRASILSTPSSANRKPPAKRRKVANQNSLTPLDAGSKTLADTSFQNTRLSCSTCHRSLSSALRPGVSVPTVCSKCSAPTCTICSRTCTSYTRFSSFPPTPALTRSPSPSPSPSHVHTSGPCPVSPKRAALGLILSTMNCDMSTISAVKRKKAPVDKEEAMVEWESSEQITSTGCRESAENCSTSVVILGCGRVICRACCIESVANDGTLCTDCYALV